MFNKFRKRPVVVEAVQWHCWLNYPFVGKESTGDPSSIEGAEVKFYVTTIHGQRAYLADGDWIIKEPDGVHHYPCKPDIFVSIYEEV